MTGETSGKIAWSSRLGSSFIRLIARTWRFRVVNAEGYAAEIVNQFGSPLEKKEMELLKKQSEKAIQKADEKALRRRIVERALLALKTEVAQPTVFAQQ